MKPKSVNVFLTALSALGQTNTSYYYFRQRDGSRKYLQASYTNEVGAKFILSREKIDRIVLVGSGMTWSGNAADVRAISEQGLSAPAVPAAPEETRRPALALPYLVSKLRDFLALEDRSAPVESQPEESRIEPERQEELKALAAEIDCLRETPDRSQWFDIASRTPNFSALLREKLRDNIERVYVTRDEYEKYRFDLAFSQLPETQWLRVDRFHIDQAFESLEKMKELRFSLLGREFYVISGLRKVEERIAALETLRQGMEEQRALAAGLWELNRRLAQELRDIKTNRLNRESAFIKEYLFSLLENKLRYLPRQSNRDAELVFVPSERNCDGTPVENIREMVEAIRAAGNGAEDTEIRLFIDMQGGGRTDGYVRNAVLSILHNESGGRFQIRQVIATNYLHGSFSNEIVDETLRYSITDLVAGMNAFLQYGKTDQLRAYFAAVHSENARIRQLLNAMSSIDEAVTTCDIRRLEEGILRLKTAFRSSGGKTEDRDAEIFSVLEEGIQRDYGRLLESDDRLNYIDLIQWALRKDFLQQAITLVEAKIPEQLFMDGILYYPCEHEERLDQYRQFKGESYPYIFVKYYILSQVMHLRRSASYKGKVGKPVRRLPTRRGANPSELDILFHAANDQIVDLLYKYNTLIDMRNKLNHAVEANERPKSATIQNHIGKLLEQYALVLRETERATGYVQK